MDGHRGEWTARDGRFAPHEHSGRPSWECRTTTQDEHLQKFHNEIGFIPGYRGWPENGSAPLAASAHEPWRTCGWVPAARVQRPQFVPQGSGREWLYHAPLEQAFFQLIQAQRTHDNDDALVVELLEAYEDQAMASTAVVNDAASDSEPSEMDSDQSDEESSEEEEMFGSEYTDDY